MQIVDSGKMAKTCLKYGKRASIVANVSIVA